MSWQVIEDLMTFREQVLRVLMDLGSTVVTLLVNYPEPLNLCFAPSSVLICSSQLELFTRGSFFWGTTH
jgi:hypothetical protein